MLPISKKYPEINHLLEALVKELQRILDNNLVGVYLYGSLVWGDFDYDTSDIDLMIAINQNLETQEKVQLQLLHQHITEKYQGMNNRTDIFYITTDTLKKGVRESTLEVFFPGKTLHEKKTGYDDIMNVYFVEKKGLTLYGPSVPELTTPISTEQFIQAVKMYTQGWSEAITKTSHTRENQSFIILTMCRALYANKEKAQLSKLKAAEWVLKEYPEWTTLIQNAITWRGNWKNEMVNDEIAFAETKKFVEFTISNVGN